MLDIVLECIRVIVIAGILIAFYRGASSGEIREIDGWRCLFSGFSLVLFGAVLDVTDNFDWLNHYVVIGDTGVQAVLEKVVGYLVGFILIAIGIWRWLPKIVEHQQAMKNDLARAEQENQILRGIVPICMHCNNIRDDGGVWNRMESFIEERSTARFSHSICDDCLELHYPDDD